jgi:anti-sigma regulatory factor (Ser/Thr protein kinase)
MTTQKIELAPEVASCSRARRFVLASLAHAPDDMRDDASLLVSEVVTNALLHAHGPVTVEVRQRGGGCRIAVSDGSSTGPAEKGYRADDATGHGLQLLERVATAWGWERTDSGKQVWFDLGRPVGDAPPSPERESYEDPYPNGRPIALLNAPVQAMIRTGAHYDAIYREFRLILELDASGRRAVPGRLLGLIRVMGTSFLGYGRPAEDAWEAAVRDDRETVDVHFRLPPEFAPAIEHYDQLLDEADEYCRQAALLTVAPSDEALAVRRWAFGQVVRQCLGKPPSPWSP